MTMKGLFQPALATVRVDLRRALMGKRGIPVLLLALLPVLLTFLVGNAQEVGPAGRLVTQYANIYRYFVLAGCLFFGTGWCFSNLFRAEVLEKTLHYFLLTPVRREAITLGKYFTGVAATWLVFGPATILSYICLFAPGGTAAVDHLTSPAGLQALAAYTGITLLACAAYGAAFLGLGVVARSPFVPIVAFWLFERASVFLPSILKRLTMIHYLDSLMPVPATTGPFAVLAEPVPLPLAVLVPMVLAASVVALSAWKVRGMEVAYGAE